jgi:hypothetical protein
MAEGTWVGLDVHARKVVTGVLDAGTGELRSLRVRCRPRRFELISDVRWVVTSPTISPILLEAVGRVSRRAVQQGAGLAQR